MSLCIGLMSGTSADGMDACLVDISEEQLRFVDATCIEYPAEITQFLQALAGSEVLSAELVMDADRLIAQYSVQAVVHLLDKHNLSPADIAFVASHGHTLRHRPQPDGFSWQIGDPSWIAEYTGITCVADFRRRDIAAGGHGAPLVPAFHRFMLNGDTSTAIVNIGGIANVTLPDGTGFDTGPGNILMDEFCRQAFSEPCDYFGAKAASGSTIEALLNQWLSHPYFSELPPKSTGREMFNLAALNSDLSHYAAEDILNTLTELTARSIADAVKLQSPECKRLLICGGGAKNIWLKKRLADHLPGVEVKDTQAISVDPDWMEAMAFAWLGWRTINSLSGNLPVATGADGERILGGIYPA